MQVCRASDVRPTLQRWEYGVLFVNAVDLFQDCSWQTKGQHWSKMTEQVFTARLRNKEGDPEVFFFWITLRQGVELVAKAAQEAVGGEVFVPKIPSMRVLDLARVIIPQCEYEVIGIRPGEKLHESLISKDEGRNTVDMDEHYVILPLSANGSKKFHKYSKHPKMGEGFSYRSDTNDHWLSAEDLTRVVTEVESEGRDTLQQATHRAG